MAFVYAPIDFGLRRRAGQTRVYREVISDRERLTLTPDQPLEFSIERTLNDEVDGLVLQQGEAVFLRGCAHDGGKLLSCDRAGLSKAPDEANRMDCDNEEREIREREHLFALRKPG